LARRGIGGRLAAGGTVRGRAGRGRCARGRSIRLPSSRRLSFRWNALIRSAQSAGRRPPSSLDSRRGFPGDSRRRRRGRCRSRIRAVRAASGQRESRRKCSNRQPRRFPGRRWFPAGQRAFPIARSIRHFVERPDDVCRPECSSAVVKRPGMRDNIGILRNLGTMQFRNEGIDGLAP